MTPPLVRVGPDRLGLREPADAAARSVELADLLRTRLPEDLVRADLLTASALLDVLTDGTRRELGPSSGR